MTNIKIIFTGGTIGSRMSGASLDVTGEAPYELIEHYGSRSGVAFDPCEPINTLSENMTPQDWKDVYNSALPALEDADGIIITHGTDTIAYTACLFSFLLKHAAIPVMFVSSQYPLSDPRADGFKNFAAAVDFIKNASLPGVYVPVASGDAVDIHLGSRIIQAEPFTHVFKSAGNIPFGVIRSGRFGIIPAEINPSAEALRKPRRKLCCPFPEMADIALIKPHPGMNYSFRFSRKPAAILHELYHSGTARAETGGPYGSIAGFAREMIEAGVDFYAAPFDSRKDSYASVRAMESAGVRVMKDMSVESCLIKLSLAYGLFAEKSDINAFLSENLFFEYI